MSRSTKDAWLNGPGDLKESEVEDVPVKGQSVKIRALSATAANAATSESLKATEVRGQQVMKVDNVLLDIIRFQQGVVEPSFSTDEVKVISAKYGPAFQRVVKAIAELSGIDEETAHETDARFPGNGIGSPEANGAGAAEGHDGPVEPVRTGSGSGDVD